MIISDSTLLKKHIMYAHSHQPTRTPRLLCRSTHFTSAPAYAGIQVPSIFTLFSSPEDVWRSVLFLAECEYSGDWIGEQHKGVWRGADKLVRNSCQRFCTHTESQTTLGASWRGNRFDLLTWITINPWISSYAARVVQGKVSLNPLPTPFPKILL